MSFDFYFAGTQHNSGVECIVSLNGNMLRSYYNDKSHIKKLIELKKEGKWKGKLLVDSGAFTCWTKGVEINADDYINYINENGEYVDYFIQLDKIPGTPHRPPTLEEAQESTDKSWENYLYMLEKVKYPEKILPVFHKREPQSFLKQMIEHKHNGVYTPYICLGGLARIKDPKGTEQWLKSCFDTIQRSENPNVKIHNLGCANWDLLQKYPFYSSDAASWIRAGSVGYLMSHYGLLCVSNNQSSSFIHIDNVPEDYKKYILNNCEEFGLDFNEIRENYRARSLYNIHYLIKRAKEYKYVGHKSFVRKKLF